jgi:hypothetical protein
MLRAGAAILAAAVVPCTSAAGAAPPNQPTPEKLWEVYPLNPKPKPAETHATTTVAQTPSTTVSQASPAPRETHPAPAQPTRRPQPDRERSAPPSAMVAAASAGALALVLVIAALVFTVSGSDGSTQRPRRRGGWRRRSADAFSPPLRAIDGGDLDEAERPSKLEPAEAASEAALLRAKLPMDAGAPKSEQIGEADVDVLKAKREHREAQKVDTMPDLDTLKAKRAAESQPKREPAPAEVVEADVLRAKRQATPTETVDALIAKLNPEPDSGQAHAPPKPVLVAVADQPARARPRRPARRDRAIERCTVHWWRGYVKSEFYATTEDGEARPIATSPAFRWRKTDPPPERGTATRALAALVEQLEAEGWRATGRGNDWFALRFRRRAGPEGGDTDTSN